MEKPALDHYGSSYTALMWDGLNGYAVLPSANRSSRWSEIFARSFVLQPRIQTTFDSVLVVGQRPTDSAVLPVIRRYGSIDFWVNEVCTQIFAAYPNLIVRYKAHPREIRAGKPYFIPKGVVDYSMKSLEDALSNVVAVITMSGTVGVDAVLKGIPVISYDPGSLVWNCSSHSINCLPDCPLKYCQHLFNNLAYTMWTTDEITAGTALKFMFNPDNF